MIVQMVNVYIYSDNRLKLLLFPDKKKYKQRQNKPKPTMGSSKKHKKHKSERRSKYEGM